MVVFRSICVSQHLNSFCRELFLRHPDFLFAYLDADPGENRRAAGWTNQTDFPSELQTPAMRESLNTVEVLVDMCRDLDLFEDRAHRGLLTFYTNERWFKPIGVKVFGLEFLLPGFLRMLHPCYLKMAWRFARLMRSDRFICLPIGVHAARDFARICGLFHGDLRCLFRAPHLEFERKPGGRIEGFANMFMWGYFVEPSKVCAKTKALGGYNQGKGLRILWVGRMCYLKRVDTIIEAVKQMSGAALDLYGCGTDLQRLQDLAGDCDRICFHNFVHQSKVRELMRLHDVYVFSSDGRDGWGAVVSEALAEGMQVVGTYETGASPTMLSNSCLYHAGNVEELVTCLTNVSAGQNAKLFTGDVAAEWICDIISKKVRNEVV